MRYHVLACDYDGTVAHHGKVSARTLAALKKVKETGRWLMLVTGRELDDLAHHFSELEVFDQVVAENGALLYTPATHAEKPLAEPPSDAFVRALEQRNVTPLSVGRVIVATWTPQDKVVFDVIHELGLELQVIFNKGAVMVLPPGVNKASGLSAALAEMKLSPHNCVGVGDAENDHAFLALCECSVAVANALPALKERADLVTEADHGRGVTELIGRMIDNDLADLGPRLTRHDVLLGADAKGQELRLRPHVESVMVAGTSGGGKSTLTTGLLERFIEDGYQVCIVDPEGDYEHFEQSVALGTSDNPPAVPEALAVLNDPRESVTLNLLALGVAAGREPAWFRSLPPRHQLRRHLRKYAEGKLGEDRSFYFRGPGNRLNLRAANLTSFIEIGAGLDDETWLFHLRNGDYSRWFSTAIKDEDLASEVSQVEQSPDISAGESLDRIRQAIDKRYTLPA